MSSKTLLENRVNQLLSNKSEYFGLSPVLDSISEMSPKLCEKVPSSGALGDSLRNDFELENVVLAQQCLSEMERFLKQIENIQQSVVALDTKCTEIANYLQNTQDSTTKYVEQAHTLSHEKQVLENQLHTVKDFISKYQLTDEEIDTLGAPIAEENADKFFQAMDRIQQIKQDCQELLSSSNEEHSSLELLEAINVHHEKAMTKLYQWTQSKCSDTETEPTELLQRALACLKNRPAFYIHCKEMVVGIRRSLIVRSFITALTRGGPGGVPRPIEIHAHDSLRYIGDMLAWIHQTLATEKEFLDVLFQGDACFPLLKEVNDDDDDSEENRIANENCEDSSLSETMVGKIFQGVSKPLQIRIQQVLTSQQELVLAYKLVHLLAFYHHTISNIIGSCTFNNDLLTCRELSIKSFNSQLHRLEDYILTSTPGYMTDLSASHLTVDISHRVADLVEIFETSFLPANEKGSDISPIIDTILSALLKSCQQHAEEAIKDDHISACVFMLNNIGYIQTSLNRFPGVNSWREKLTIEIDNFVDKLSDYQTKFVLHRCSIASLIERVNRSKDSEIGCQIDGLDQSTISRLMHNFCGSLMALAFPKLDSIFQPKIREQARLKTAVALAAIHQTLYNFIQNERNQYTQKSQILQHSPEEIRTLLEIE